MVERDQLPCWRCQNIWIAYSRTQSRRNRSRFLRKSTTSLGSNYTVKFSKNTWHHMKNRERKGPSRGVIQKCEPHERNPCANKFAERTRDETLHQERCASQSSMGLGEKCLWAQKYIFCYVLLSYWSQDNASAHFKMLRGTRMCGWFQSINAHAEQKGFEPRRNGDSTEVLGTPQRW